MSLYKFDFSATHDIAFIHTIGGGHVSNATASASGPVSSGTQSLDTFPRTGFNGLCRGIRELGLATDQQIVVDYVTSSVGSLNGKLTSTPFIAYDDVSPITAPDLKVSRPYKCSVCPDKPTRVSLQRAGCYGAARSCHNLGPSFLCRKNGYQHPIHVGW